MKMNIRIRFEMMGRHCLPVMVRGPSVFAKKQGIFYFLTKNNKFTPLNLFFRHFKKLHFGRFSIFTFHSTHRYNPLLAELTDINTIY